MKRFSQIKLQKVWQTTKSRSGLSFEWILLLWNFNSTFKAPIIKMYNIEKEKLFLLIGHKEMMIDKTWFWNAHSWYTN